MAEHPYKSDPMEHQVRGLKRAWRKPEFALFWEMGTGKTFTVVNLAAARYMKEQINALVVICPTPIKMVWEEELRKWCPVDHTIVTIQADKGSKSAAIGLGESKTDHSLKVLIVGVEALSQGNAASITMDFVKRNRTMVVADESSRLKNHKSNRTKKACSIASHALYRIILTGTPVTQGIEDLFGQFSFLNPDILSCKSYFIFRNRYCLTRSMKDGNNRAFEKVVGYQNTDDLMKRIAPYVDMVKKEEVLDLPPKVYEKISVEPTQEQLRLIRELIDNFETEHQTERLVTETVLERLTRFQQIIGGNFPYEHRVYIDDKGRPRREYKTIPIEGKNPKLNALSEILEDLPLETKVIIWCRFNPEVDQIKNLISSMWSEEQVVTFVGDDSNDERKMNVRRFQDGNARVIISKPQLGGMGQTWTAATLVIYYSNDFSFENRMQSEDRAHRKGQEHAVTYIDIEANHKYDKMILKAIRKKQDVANYVDERIDSEQLAEIARLGKL